MIKSIIPRVAVANDLSGFGRVSLTEACPILSAMGVEACPLPTAVLSTHTYKFNDYSFCDMTEQMEKMLCHWRKLDIRFDAICTGYMAGAGQIELLSEFIAEKKAEGCIAVIDPVLGDNALLDAETVYYDRMNELLVSMKKFVSLADVITPNLTEACLLLDKKYPKTHLSESEVKEIALELTKLGPKKIAITSVMVGKNEMKVAVLDKEEGFFELLDCGYVDRPFHGTGDIFAAVLTGAMSQKKGVLQASKLAVDFVKAAISETLKYKDMKTEYGVVFETILAKFFADKN